MPGDVPAEDVLDGQVEAAVAGEQGTDTHPVTVAPKSYPRRVALFLTFGLVPKPEWRGSYSALGPEVSPGFALSLM
jgi:hypothetical protein